MAIKQIVQLKRLAGACTKLVYGHCGNARNLFYVFYWNSEIINITKIYIKT